MKEIKKIAASFDMYYGQLYLIVKQMAAKGLFKELFAHLDFNRYFIKKD